MQVQAIRSFIAACVLASAMHAAPADETVLFANYNTQDQPSLTRGGWRIGGTTLEKGNSGQRAIGMLITPSSTGYLGRIEVVLKHESGGHSLTGYLMTDASGPGNILARLSFSVPDSSQPQVVSAAVDGRPLIRESQQYWLVLEAQDAVADSTFWPRREGQPATSIAFGTSDSAKWRVQPGTFGAMLRLYGEAMMTPPPEERVDEGARPMTTSPLSFDSLIDQKFILLHVGDNEELRVKKDRLVSLRGDCDIAVQVKEAKRRQGKVNLLLEKIGVPSGGHCTKSITKVSIEISGFKDDESPESLAASVNEILKTPEQYLAARGIALGLPPAPDNEQTVHIQAQGTPPKPLLMIDGEFSEEARRAKYQGTVVVTIVVGTDGRIHQARILRGVGMGLNEAALRVLPLCRFEPARQAGRPVAVRMQMEMSFNFY